MFASDSDRIGRLSVGGPARTGARAARAEVVSGFYHSHPDHPAKPSAFDTEHAGPWYTYPVVSVEPGGPREVGAFELDAEHQRFHLCPLEVLPGSHGRGDAGPIPGR